MKATISILFVLATMVACTTSKPTAEVKIKLRGGLYEVVTPVRQSDTIKTIFPDQKQTLHNDVTELKSTDD